MAQTSSESNNIFKILIIILLVIVVAYVAYYLYSNMNNKNTPAMEQVKPQMPVAQQQMAPVQQQRPVAMSNKMGQEMGMETFTNGEEYRREREQSGFPKDQLNADELLPSDNSTLWAQVNPAGEGSLKDRNFLQAGYHIGINTVGQTLRNANLQLRSEPPCPQVRVSPWINSTIEPDLGRKPFEIGGCA